MGILVWVILSPARSEVEAGSFGMFRSTYFSPNRVLGTRAAVTFLGIDLILSGLMPRVSVAPCPSDSALLTWPTMTPRTFTSALAGRFRPTVLVFRVTVSNEVNFWVNTALTSHTDRTSRPTKTMPRLRWWSRSRFCTSSPSQSDGRRGAPDGDREEQVDHVDGHDGGPHRTSHGHAHAGRTAAGGVAVVAVDQDDDDREHEHLAEGPQHVTRWQELVEVVVVGAGALAVELGHRQAGGEVGGEQPHDVQRDDRDQAGDDAGGHQERHRGDRH